VWAPCAENVVTRPARGVRIINMRVLKVTHVKHILNAAGFAKLLQA